MADMNKFVPKLLKWEGGYAADPDDRGGATKYGVTEKTWEKSGYDKNADGRIDAKDVALLSESDMSSCILPVYWKRWQADRIGSQAMAEILVDWLWMSGDIAVKRVQHLLGLNEDGIVGEKTLAAINAYPDRRKLFERIKNERRGYIDRICSLRPANIKFRKGWLARLKDFKWFVCLILSVAFSFMSCKSSTERELLKETKDSLLSESERRVESRQYSASGLKAEENSQAKETENTVIYSVEYDTSARRDSLTGAYPVKKERKEVRQKSRCNETIRQSLARRSDSVGLLKSGKEKSLISSAQTSDEKKIKSGRHPPAWVSILSACLLIGGLAYGMAYLKRKSFF